MVLLWWYEYHMGVHSPPAPSSIMSPPGCRLMNLVKSYTFPLITTQQSDLLSCFIISAQVNIYFCFIVFRFSLTVGSCFYGLDCLVNIYYYDSLSEMISQVSMKLTLILTSLSLYCWSSKSISKFNVIGIWMKSNTNMITFTTLHSTLFFQFSILGSKSNTYIN